MPIAITDDHLNDALTLLNVGGLSNTAKNLQFLSFFWILPGLPILFADVTRSTRKLAWEEFQEKLQKMFGSPCGNVYYGWHVTCWLTCILLWSLATSVRGRGAWCPFCVGKLYLNARAPKKKKKQRAPKKKQRAPNSTWIKTPAMQLRLANHIFPAFQTIVKNTEN